MMLLYFPSPGTDPRGGESPLTSDLVLLTIFGSIPSENLLLLVDVILSLPGRSCGHWRSRDPMTLQIDLYFKVSFALVHRWFLRLKVHNHLRVIILRPPRSSITFFMT